MPSSVRYEKCSASSARSVASEILISDVSFAFCNEISTAPVSFDVNGDCTWSIKFWSNRCTTPDAQKDFLPPASAELISMCRNGLWALTSSACFV